tara:strand:+ start:465 stop:1052 length:588 start_codon:yes stop_codon:yes gene_type:complete
LKQLKRLTIYFNKYENTDRIFFSQLKFQMKTKAKAKDTLSALKTVNLNYCLQVDTLSKKNAEYKKELKNKTQSILDLETKIYDLQEDVRNSESINAELEKGQKTIIRQKVIIAELKTIKLDLINQVGSLERSRSKHIDENYLLKEQLRDALEQARTTKSNLLECIDVKTRALEKMRAAIFEAEELKTTIYYLKNK